ncbi:MAG: peptidoglycan DD-metalloendopeptidase family protein [bacterium]
MAVAVVALCLLASGCVGGVGAPPVINKSPQRIIPAEVVARAGDSVYSIAWDFGLDHRKIAKWNRLAKPYPIRAGQRLRLRPSSGAATNNTSAVATKPVATQSVTPKPKPAAPTTRQQPAASTSAAAPTKWRWPAKGELISKFSRANGRNGIAIAGAPGSPIHATAAGEVVYAGEGLRGYGKLIIVKHSPAYLSAYAHNRKILVAEGARVRAGERIAQMGSSGAERTMLHFEIRKNGEPQDPLAFLR